jgi:hypothetical protein
VAAARPELLALFLPLEPRAERALAVVDKAAAVVVAPQ